MLVISLFSSQFLDILSVCLLLSFDVVYTSWYLLCHVSLCVLCSSVTHADKNSSGAEIANVNFFCDDIAHVLRNTIKENLFRLTN